MDCIHVNKPLMKHFHYALLLFLLFVSQIAAAQNQWAWMNGEQSANINGSYGNRGIAAPTNNPGSRTGATSWTDDNGMFWLFGGRGNGETTSGLLNDLWRYDPTSHQWTWVDGSKEAGATGTYGFRGLPLPSNYPGARENSVSWTDNSGNLWLFGGNGYASNGNSPGLLNDLWRYNPSTRQWTWISGSSQLNSRGNYGRKGRTSLTSVPGGRSMAAAWKDAQGNLWLFGGNGYASNNDRGDLNDLWVFSLAFNVWTWMHGEDEEDDNGRYGRKEDFNNRNTPPGRRGSTAWTDRNGNFWLFGGRNRSGLFSDLWKFDVGDNQWAWMSGSDEYNEEPRPTQQGVPDVNGNPGARFLASGWIDGQGSLWLFGGKGYGGDLGQQPLNSLWKYSLTNGDWTFVKGQTAISPAAVYGTKGESAAGNRPGGTANAASWIDKQGNLWMFGGEATTGNLNQTWEFMLMCSEEISGTIAPASAAVCNGGSQKLIATGGSSYEWQLDGETIPGQTSSSITVTEPGTYSVIIKNGNCSAPASNTAVITEGTLPTGTISPATAAICEGGSQVLKATGGTSYEWRRDGVRINGETDSTITVNQAGTYSVIIKKGSCSGPASNSTVVTLTTVPSGTISPETASLCTGGSQVLTATGGTSYEWQRDGQTINGETGATLTVTAPGTYSVIIKNGSCTGPASNKATVTLDAATGTRYADVTVAAGEPATLTARAIGETYEWTPATGLNDPASPTPTVTANTETQYLVNITPAEGCMVTDTVLVKIAGEEVPGPEPVKKKIFVPTAFTPNGNNVNDRLRPLGQLATIDFFRVYNRWGNLMFQTNVLGEGWNGQHKGVTQPADTYTWILSGKTTDGEQVKLSGKTFLIR